MIRRHRLLALLLAITVVAAACSSADSADPGDEPGNGTGPGPDADVPALALPDFELAAELRPLGSCDELLEHLRTTAASAVGAYGFGNGYYGGPGIAGAELADDATTTRAVAPQTAGDAVGTEAEDGDTGGSFSGTNVQEARVDEPDIVKTDGERIVSVLDSTLRIYDLPTESVVGSVGLPGWNHQLFLAGDRAWVIAAGGGEMIVDTLPAADVEYYPGNETTTLIEVDLSDPADPVVANQMEVEGTFLNARLVDGTAHLVVRSQPLGFSFVQPTGPGSIEVAEETNRRILAEADLDQWLPRAAVIEGEGGSDDIDLVECDRVLAPREFSGFGMLSVIDFPVDSGLSTTTTSVLGDGDTVYASPDALYVAGARWIDWQTLEEDGDDGQDRLTQLAEQYSTDIHKFDVGSGTADYVASGQVIGTPVNQFAMSESDGVLRIATTAGSPWSEGTDQSESFMTTLRVDGDALVEVGRTGDMGRGETIRSVRYVGDTAYVVTFQQTDPFYTVDLSDPAAPRVVGELKILGYSGYLHPVGEDLILGVGQDATEDGLTTGAKVTLFDVSDPADPRAVANWTDDGATADVEWDHKAFLYWEPEALAVLPLSDWSSGFFGAVGFDIGEGSLAERGRVSNATAGEPDADGCTVVTEELLEETGNGALVELARGTYTRICGPNDQPGQVAGHSCEIIPIEEISARVGIEVELDDEIVAPGSTVQLCYPDGNGEQIVRSIVVGDDLWTLSSSGLRSSDLTTLEPTGWIPAG